MDSISPKKGKTLFNPISFLSEEQKLVSLASDPGLINIKCLFAENYNIYSLQALQNKDSDYELKDKDGNKLLYNFCQNTNKYNESTFVKIGDNETVVKLAGSIDGEGEDKNKWSQIGNESQPIGLLIDLVQGDACGTGRHQTQIEIFCDASVDKIDKLEFKTTNNCNHKLTFHSLYGCTLRSSYLFLRLLQDYKIVFCIIFVLVGVSLCFCGNRFLEIVIIFVSGLIACYAVTAAILHFFPNFLTTELYLLICLLVCFIIGCGVGIFLRKEVKFAVVVLGGFLGYCAATFVYQIVQKYIDYDPQVVYYGTLIGCCIIGAVIGYFLSEIIIILATSVLGGYLAMRGVSLVAGHYLDEGLVMDLIKNKEWDQLNQFRDNWTYAYLGSWAILAFVGIILQCKHQKKEKGNKI